MAIAGMAPAGIPGWTRFWTTLGTPAGLVTALAESMDVTWAVRILFGHLRHLDCGCAFVDIGCFSDRAAGAIDFYSEDRRRRRFVTAQQGGGGNGARCASFSGLDTM